MGLKLQKSRQLHSSGVDHEEQVTFQFRVSSMEQEEYHLALQGGCDPSSLTFAICFSLLGREMWSPFSGPVFGDRTLSCQVPALQGECSQLDHFWLPPERAALTTGWPKRFQRERASVESFSRACASARSQAAPFGQ